MANENKLVNAGNLKQAVQGVYNKSQANLTAEATTARAAEKANADAIAQEIEDRGAAISAEATARDTADQGLQNAIDKEVEDRQAAIDQVTATIGVPSRAADAEQGIEAQEATGLHKTIEDEHAAIREEIEDGDTFKVDMLTVSALGGIKAGQDLNNMSVQEVLTKLLYPHVKPTVGTVSTTPSTSVREHGNYQTVTQVSASVSKKSNPITKVELLKNSTVIETKTDIANGGTATFSNLSEITANGTKFTVKAYALNEAGTAEESVSSSSGAFTYVYPYYQGVVAEGAEITGELVAGLTKKVEAKGTKSYTYTTNNQHAVFAYPKSYNPLASSKAIFDPNNFDVTGTFTRYEVQVVGLDGTSQAYYVYVSGASTVSGFTYKFTM